MNFGGLKVEPPAISDFLLEALYTKLAKREHEDTVEKIKSTLNEAQQLSDYVCYLNRDYANLVMKIADVMLDDYPIESLVEFVETKMKRVDKIADLEHALFRTAVWQALVEHNASPERNQGEILADKLREKGWRYVGEVVET